MAIISNSTQQG